MVRTQIQLTEDQARMLRELSLSNNKSVAALIREAIDRFLLTGKPNRGAQYRQAMSLVGKYTTEQPDTAVEHDRYLEEAFGS
ncbi:ribbon-helix-helix protein, CopG family [bacterium]|nr:ribbon-helix-helix protein, CopG family [bacterium]